MWAILITCLSTYCQPMPTEPPAIVYSTREQCERDLKIIYEGWIPRRGAYSFKCVFRYE